jgi:hypothetical protein
MVASGSFVASGNGLLWANLVLHLHLDLPVVRALVMNVSLLQGVEMVLCPGETYATGAASGNGTADTFGGGAVSASNIFGQAGGLGSGSTVGSTTGGGLTVKGIGISGLEHLRSSLTLSDRAALARLLPLMHLFGTAHLIAL